MSREEDHPPGGDGGSLSPALSPYGHVSRCPGRGRSLTVEDRDRGQALGSGPISLAVPSWLQGLALACDTALLGGPPRLKQGEERPRRAPGPCASACDSRKLGDRDSRGGQGWKWGKGHSVAPAVAVRQGQRRRAAGGQLGQTPTGQPLPGRQPPGEGGPRLGEAWPASAPRGLPPPPALPLTRDSPGSDPASQQEGSGNRARRRGPGWPG